MIVITGDALQKIRELQTTMPESQGKKFRVRVDAGGCSGLTYDYSFDDQHEGDLVCECDGVTVLLDTQSVPFVDGATIDYREDFQQTGFVVQNPNSTTSCGCGKSFGV